MSTRLMGWLAFAGWIIIPSAVMIAANLIKPDTQRSYIQDAGLVLMAGAFIAGLMGLAHSSPRTWGRWTAGAFNSLGVLSLTALAVIGFRTEVSDLSTEHELSPFYVKRSWLWHDIGYSSGFKDRTGKVVIPPRFKFASGFHEGLAVVLWNGRWGAIDEKGDWAIQPEHEDAFAFMSEGKLAVRRGKQWGFIDRAGRLVIPPRFEEATRYTEGRAAVKLGGKWGFIDVAGKVVVEPHFDAVWPFSEGLAQVKLGGEVRNFREVGERWGYVDTSGNLVIEIRFLTSNAFKNGRAEVVDEEGLAVIDRAGKVIERPKPPGEEEEEK